MGVPEMLELWESLQSRVESGEASSDEKKKYNALHKALKLISADPKHPGLHTHEIDALTSRYGVKVFQSYCENNKPGAMRIYWVYGPKKGYITIIGLEPHPNDAKGNAYKKIRLSKMSNSVD